MKFEFTLPKELENNISVQNYFNDWKNLLMKEKIKAKKELRLKKINEINAKYK